MQQDFKPPQNEEEFKERAKTVTTEGARAVVQALRARRKQAVAKIDEEINFYERILKERGDEA